MHPPKTPECIPCSTQKMCPQPLFCRFFITLTSQGMQAFNWESHRQNWWETMSQQAQLFADMGFTLVWLPPPTASVAAQGYMPLDLYNLNSAYGSEDSLRRFTKNPFNIDLSY